MASQHTPGPWTVEESAHQHGTEIYIVAPGSNGGTFIAMAPRSHTGDARLIAAAPEMLEALTRIIYAGDQCQGHRNCGHSMEPWQQARALLARIEGKA